MEVKKERRNDMKNKKLILGAMVGVLLTGGLVFADSFDKTVDIAYRGIKIFVDGAQYITKDANGNDIEPFIYDGTTYLPVRGVANMFEKDVLWDGKNMSIYIGKTGENQSDTWLNQQQYTYCGEGYEDHNLWCINGTVTDYAKNNYTNGMLFIHIVLIVL